ncbi:MAG: HEAT repeat domain-containing protein [Planctomycetes bacterium]|nr:HEAT repeat domain-containing protein [Planctomycetota bacterium]
MNKTILIIIGLGCALLAAAGIMQHTHHTAHKKIHICYDTEVEPIVADDNAPGWVKDFFDESNKANNNKELVNQGIPHNKNDNNSGSSSSTPLNYEEIKQLINAIKAECGNTSSSFGPRAIYRIDAVRDGPAIMNLLNDPDGSVRESAAFTLGLMGIKESIPELRKLLYDSEPNVRKTAIETLNSLGAVKNTPEIIHLLNDKDSWTRRAAVIVLGQSDMKDAIPEITELLTDSDEYVRVCAIDALASLSGREAVPEIIKLLDDKVKYVRSQASITLINLDDKSVIPSMIELLQDKPERARDGVACALGALGAIEAIPLFIKLLGHSEVDARLGAIAALRHMGAKETFTCYVCHNYTGIRPLNERCQMAAREAIPELIKLINDEDEYIQSLVALVLGQLDAKEAIPQLLERLDEKHKYHATYTPSGAVLALVELGAKNQIPFHRLEWCIDRLYEFYPAKPEDLQRRCKAALKELQPPGYIKIWKK